MFSPFKSRNALLMATILLLSSAQPAFTSVCQYKPGSTATQCSQACAWAAVGGLLGFLLCR